MNETINWIPVDQQLPDDETTVMTCHQTLNEPVWLGYFLQENWYSTTGDYLGKNAVTHWAEMPAGPQNSQNNH